MLVLPRLPEKQRGERKDDKKNQALGVHDCRNRIVMVLGNRIVPAGMIGMAAPEAPRGKPDAADRAMALDRLARIVGAAGIKAAVRAEQRTQRVLV